MQIPKPVYDVVKYLVLIVIPAFSAAYVGIDSAVGLPAVDAVVKILAVVAALLGTLVGLSAAQWANNPDRYDGVIDPMAANAQTSDTAFNLQTDEFDAMNQKEVVLKVKSAPDSLGIVEH